ncbi:MAG: leucine-rich repeat domain-containing protein, partial [Oscillospiraceae bacterium]|nr:leucine-rich repeat domain-containing protein [Oscillospiraceae bacterium]
DISCLAVLSDLEYLCLSNDSYYDDGQNRVRDFTPLHSLTNLKELVVWRNDINDLSTFVGITSLEFLWVGENPIIDYSILHLMPNLKELNVLSNNINDLSSFSGLTNLESLKFGGVYWGNPITDVSPLITLTNLKCLYLRNSRLTDVSPLSQMTNLEVLDISNNTSITDISPLFELPNLREFYIGTRSTELSFENEKEKATREFLEEQIEVLRELLPDCEIWLREPNF